MSTMTKMVRAQANGNTGLPFLDSDTKPVARPRFTMSSVEEAAREAIEDTLRAQRGEPRLSPPPKASEKPQRPKKQRPTTNAGRLAATESRRLRKMAAVGLKAEANKNTATPAKASMAKAALQVAEARGKRVVFIEDGLLDPKVMSASGAAKWLEWYGKDSTCEIEILPVLERTDMPELYMVECLNVYGKMEFISGMIFSKTDAARYCSVLERNGMEPKAYRIVNVVTLEEATPFPAGDRPAKQTREASQTLSDTLGREVKAA